MSFKCGAHSDFPSAQVLWTWSIYLEAVAILPQLVRPVFAAPHPPQAQELTTELPTQVMLQNSGNVDNLTGHYVFFLGCAPSQPRCNPLHILPPCDRPCPRIDAGPLP